MADVQYLGFYFLINFLEKKNVSTRSCGYICLVLNDTFALGQKPAWQEEPSVALTAIQW